MSEYALMGVVPFCPICGGLAMFTRRSESVNDLVPTICSHAPCGWKGLSRVAVPQPMTAPADEAGA